MIQAPMFRVFLFTFLLALCGTVSTHAQNKAADKIVAVVGNRIILQSEVNQQFESEKMNNPDLPDSIKCDIFYNLVAQKILIEQAIRDSITVSDEYIDNLLDQRIRYWINQYGSQERLESASGKSVYQIKEDYRDFFKDKAVAEEMQNHIMKNVKITPVEVQAYFNKIPKDSLPLLPATVEVGEIVMHPKIDPEIEQLTKDKLEGIRRDITENGSNFGTMASLYSVDGSKDDGGLIKINKTQFDPQFVAASFRLQPGEVSPIVKSKFGYHIIKMEKRMGEEALVRHILLIPEPSSFSLNETVKKLDSVRADLVSGKINFPEAVGKYSTDEQSKMTGGLIYDNQGSPHLQINSLQDPTLATTVSNLNVGEYSQPQIFIDPFKNMKAVRILYIKNKTDPHIFNLNDDYNDVQRLALEEKQVEYLHSWLTKHIHQYFIKIDDDYKSCPQVKGWK